ncbi:MAG: hypothetical protein NTX45_29480 [Proteobacteria bacterium]|nr:hypothetical protein [Pseudomonadota bacterium]
MTTRKCSNWFGVIIVFALVLQGCSSTPFNIAPMPPVKYQTLGKASSGACGALLGAFIPIGLGSRVEKAYERALATVPGATALLNTELKEDWYWWYIGVSKCVTITGDAIRG